MDGAKLTGHQWNVNNQF